MYSFNSKRIYWILTVLASLIIVSAIFVSPPVQAQDRRNYQNEQSLQTFRQIFNYVQQNYVDEINADVLLEGALKGLFESLEDPYSVYLDSSDIRSLNDTTSGEFGGVGIYINKVRTSEDEPELLEWVEIVSPIEGTPAHRAGLRPRDLIVEIENESTIEMSIDEVVDKLRGRPNTLVNITILRNLNNRFSVDLRRAVIVIPTVRYAGVQEDIGYVRIIQFTPNTAERTEEALVNLQEEGYRDIILDLRTNPGGLLNAVVDTADLFFDDGLIVGTSARSESESQAFYAKQGTRLARNAQIVVLIDEGTASAAEILAGALKDRDRAAVIGTNSYGKGSVQQIRTIDDSGFRLTMSRYYTPNEVYIDQIGISPDIEITEDELSEEEEEALALIQSRRLIEAFLDERNNNPNEAHIQEFIQLLENEGLGVSERMLRRLVKVEIEARLNETSVFDLDYDLVLQEAVTILQENRTQSIIESRGIRSSNNSSQSAPNDQL